MGKLVTLVPVLILPYYCVIGGWVIKYTATMISGAVQDAAGDNYFSTFISGTGEPLLWFLLFMTATAVIVFLGVEKGIEKFSRVLMPALLVLTILLSIFVVTRPGAARRGLLFKAGFQQAEHDDCAGCFGAVVFLHVPGYGHYDHLWFLFA